MTKEIERGSLLPRDLINISEPTKLLKTLTPREQIIIEMRFGLEDGSEHKPEELGETFGVTGERVRQIEAKALGKLRHDRSHGLQTFLHGATDLSSAEAKSGKGNGNSLTAINRSKL